MKPHRPSIPPRNRAVFLPWGILFLATLAFGLAVPSTAGDDPGETVYKYRLQGALSGLVDAEGGLAIFTDGDPTPLMQTELISLTDSRRRRNDDLFQGVAAEGVSGGHRGFSSQADDDGDGLVDEDPLDGIDNDGDGLVDEDFAAISDAMVTVHLKGPGDDPGTGLEYYHWTYPHLSSAVFVNLDPSEATYAIRTSGPDWVETETRSVRHSMAGRLVKTGLTAQVSRVYPGQDVPLAEPCDPGAVKWLGVMILSRDPANRFMRDGSRLDLPLGEAPIPLVICVADTWLQLNRVLGEARSVYEGMTDPVDNQHVPWIVPPACNSCRTAEPPVFSLQQRDNGEVALTAAIAPGQSGLLDPDLFALDGRRLGVPREIVWQPAEGRERHTRWRCLSAQGLQDGEAIGPQALALFTRLLNHQARGRLVFIYEARGNVSAGEPLWDKDLPVEVTGRFFDGRPLRAMLQVDPDPAMKPESDPGQEIQVAAVMEPAAATGPVPPTIEKNGDGHEVDSQQFLEAEGQHLTLAPTLLTGWPNPFSDVIDIRFKVPGSMREAFVWKNDKDETTEIEWEGDVPWSGGQPNVSVKIYSINGQELVTLHSGTDGVGEYTAQWNGTDAFGRKVASGTYFCKLQMDGWSVTRRLVFLR